jgi:hypothetical protein
MQGKHLGFRNQQWGLLAQSSETGGTLAEDNFALNGGKNMKFKIVSAVAVCLFTALSALAQNTRVDDIEGVGTPNFIPIFTGSHKIGNSNIFQTGGAIGIGTTAPHGVLNVQETAANNFVIRGTSTRTSGFGAGVVGETSSPQGFGVLGISPSGVAVSGWMNSGSGFAVFGNNFGLDNNSGGGGVEGLINITSGFATAVRGSAIAATGPSVAIFGEQFSPEGEAGLFINRNGGNILIGSVSQNPDITVFRVDGSGTVYANGGFQPSGADFAESMAVVGDRSKYFAGDLLVIEPTANRHLTLSQQPYSSLVAGIYSTKPGMLGSTRRVDETPSKDEVPLAVVGIVPCKVTTENGPIQVGDLLVTSSTPGHAMRGTDRARMLGAVVGKALEPLPQGTGVIQVLVTLQ